MRPPLALVFLALGLVPAVPTPGAAAAPPVDPGRAEYAYQLGTQTLGSVRLECEASGVLLAGAPDAIEFTSGGGRLDWFDVVVNKTRAVVPNVTSLEYTVSVNQTIRSFEVPAGRVRVGWATNGTAALIAPGPYDAFDPDPETFTVAFTAPLARSGPARDRYGLERVWMADGVGGFVDGLVALPGWGRLIEAPDAGVAVQGSWALHLREATVEVGAVRIELPPARERTVETVGGVESIRERWQYALAQFRDAHAPLPGSLARPWCGAATWTIQGAHTAYQATGTLQGPHGNASFQNRELTLEGSFRVQDAPERAREPEWVPVHATGAGSFQSVQLDFAALAPDAFAGAPTTGGVVVAVAAAGGLGWVLWRVLGGFFMRLRQDRLLSVQARQRVWEAVAARPLCALEDLAQALGTSRETLRYHLGVLRRHGLVHAEKAGRAWRYVIDAGPNGATRGLVLAREDPKVAHALALLEAGPVGLNGLMLAVQARWGLSRMGSWKVIERATRARLVYKSRKGRDVIVCKTNGTV